MKEVKFKNRDSFLVTLDVSSLYTSIPHDDGINASGYYLEKNYDGPIPKEHILKLLRLVLENNHFIFDNQNYLQIMGTAMGSAIAPAFASLFMGKLEEEFLNTQTIKPTMWLKFLDDILYITNTVC